MNRKSLTTTVGATTAAAVALTGVLVYANAHHHGSDSIDYANKRVMQLVNANVSPNGTLTNLTGTVVATPLNNPNDAQTATMTYAPARVANQLPVRVLTSYTTAKKSGTNLNDLKGYTGKVRINLNVSNLTMKSEQLNFDVNGAQHTANAPVAVPLTLVASATMPGAKPASVITPANASSGPTTNGVLSQSKSGDPQVQWASMLAPPRLNPSANLSLVLNAKDFQIPDINLSITPGLVTDPSFSSLLNSSFNPQDNAELNLEQRTVDLMSNVQAVLDRASAAINTIRQTLNSTAQTLGAKTISDLRANAISVTQAMTGLKSNVRSLGGSLKSTLKQTGSTTTQQLQQTVQSISSMLGNPKQKPFAPTLMGGGCQAGVISPTSSQTLYGQLLQVVSMLNGYAKATDQCRIQMKKSILSSIGPASPSGSSCPAGNKTVTCSLHDLTGDLNALSDQLLNEKDALLKYDLSGSQVGVDVPRLNSDFAKATQTLQQIHDSVAGDIATLDSDTTPAKSAADAYTQALQGSSSGVALNSDMTDEARALAQSLCGMAANGPGANGPSMADIEKVRAYLTDKPCAGDPNPMPANPFNFKTNQVDNQFVGTIEDKLARNGQALAQADNMSAQIQVISTDVGTLANTVYADKATNQDAFQTVLNQLGKIQGSIRLLGDEAGNLSNFAKKARDAVGQAFDTASSTLRAQNSSAINPTIKKLVRVTQSTSTKMDTAFTKSVLGLHTAAAVIQKNSSSTLRAQRATISHTSGASVSAINNGVTNSLEKISGAVTSSTGNMGAASALLHNDLTNVLTDMGSRSGGTGLLGAMSNSAASAVNANAQVSLAGDQASSFGNVRGQDIVGMMLRAEQTKAALAAEEAMPAFALRLPMGTQHKTVYTFHLGSGE